MPDEMLTLSWRGPGLRTRQGAGPLVGLEAPSDGLERRDASVEVRCHDTTHQDAKVGAITCGGRTRVADL